MYKAKLQELSQQKRWGLPRYTAMKDGPDHLPHFKASVYVNGLSFHSPTISTSSKQAHNQAAKLAFLHFASSSGYPPIVSPFFSIDYYPQFFPMHFTKWSHERLIMISGFKSLSLSLSLSLYIYIYISTVWHAHNLVPLLVFCYFLY